jgi:murein L,D-transpeptidase YafK
MVVASIVLERMRVGALNRRAGKRGRSFPAFLLLLSVFVCAEDSPKSTFRADRVLVVKSDRTLKLLDRGRVIKTYKIALGGNPRGAKTRQGDHKTPEGVYVLDRRNQHSQFYRSIHISYPNAEDRVRARKLGVSPGGDVMLHGLPNGYGWVGSRHRARDWTDGCVAVTNEEMDEIWRAVPDGTPIEIRP